jgi:hypothetical protein
LNEWSATILEMFKRKAKEHWKEVEFLELLIIL